MLGGVASRRGQCRLTCAGEREAQAPSPRPRRAWVVPALGSDPCRRCSPEAEAAGTRPTHGLRALGGSHRVRAPLAATRGTATVPGPPRTACRASTTGDNRQAFTGTWRACSSRWRRAGGSGTARTSSGKTMGGVGVGPTPAERHRRGAALPWARPVERISCLRPKAVRRHGASWRSLLASARARVRARMAASCPFGP